MNQYYHRGEIGDILYAMSYIKAAGGGELTISDKNGHGDPQFVLLEPLAARQPWLTLKCAATPPQVGINAGHIEDLRLHIDSGGNTVSPNIIRPYFDRHNLPFTYSPWLEGVTPHEDPEPYSVINITSRYRDSKHIWGSVLPAGKMIFLGLHSEFCDFDHELRRTGYAGVLSRLHWLRTDNALQVASIIAGATSFFGNASSCLAIAQGVGQPNIYVEVDATTKNSCLYGHEHILNGTNV